MWRGQAFPKRNVVRFSGGWDSRNPPPYTEVDAAPGDGQTAANGRCPGATGPAGGNGPAEHRPEKNGPPDRGRLPSPAFLMLFVGAGGP